MRVELFFKAPIKKIPIGHEEQVGVAIEKSSKYWALDVGNHNTIISGSKDYRTSRILLTVEYLATLCHKHACLLIFVSDDTSDSIRTKVQSCGYCMIHVDTKHQCDNLQVRSLELAAAPIAIFVKASCFDMLLDKLLCFATNECTDGKFPVPAFIFVSKATVSSSAFALLMAAARGRNMRFIATGHNLNFSMQGGYAFDIVISGYKVGGPTICNRGNALQEGGFWVEVSMTGKIKLWLGGIWDSITYWLCGLGYWCTSEQGLVVIILSVVLWTYISSL